MDIFDIKLKNYQDKNMYYVIHTYLNNNLLLLLS